MLRRETNSQRNCIFSHNSKLDPYLLIQANECIIYMKFVILMSYLKKGRKKEVEKNTNRELMELYEEAPINNIVRKQKMRWLGHGQRLEMKDLRYKLC